MQNTYTLRLLTACFLCIGTVLVISADFQSQNLNAQTEMTGQGSISIIRSGRHPTLAQGAPHAAAMDEESTFVTRQFTVGLLFILLGVLLHAFLFLGEDGVWHLHNAAHRPLKQNRKK